MIVKVIAIAAVVVWTAMFMFKTSNMNMDKCDETIIIFKPDALERHLQIYLHELLENNKFVIREERTFTWTGPLIYSVYREHLDKPFFKDLYASLYGKQSTAILVMHKDAVKHWRLMVKDIRMEYQLDPTRNTVHGSDSCRSVAREKHFLFEWS